MITVYNFLVINKLEDNKDNLQKVEDKGVEEPPIKQGTDNRDTAISRFRDQITSEI